MAKYTLDRFEEGYGVLLKHPAEEEQLLIPKEDLQGINKGDILLVQEDDTGYMFIPLPEETAIMKSQIKSLIEKLKNK